MDGYKVLLVDDEEDILNLLEKVLNIEGFNHIFKVGDGLAAVEACRELNPVIFISLFLSPNGTTGLYSRIMFLLPYRASMPKLSNYVSYQFGGLVLDVFSMQAIMYGVLAVIIIPFAGISFKKHQG